MTSDFLGPVTEIFAFALILVSWIPRIISMNFPFLEASWSMATLNFDSDLVLEPPWSFYTSQTQTDAPICFSTITSEILYSLLRIGCAEHQIQFTSILGSSAQSVSECVLEVSLLITEPLQAFIYTACARPILSFPRSKTEKYSLRKTSPSIQFSLDVLTVSSLKVL